MKKFTVILVVGTIVPLFFFSSCGNKKVPPEKSIQRIFGFKKASVKEEALNANTAKTFPQTLIFYMKGKGSSVIILNTLPTTLKIFDRLFATEPQHGNVTVIQKENGKKLGIMPRDIFGEDFETLRALEKAGLKAIMGKNLITFNLNSDMQKALNVSLFKKIKTKEIDDSSCIIRALNCFKNDSFISQYVIRGDVHYITNQEKKYLMKEAITSTGEKSDFSDNEEGMYVVRVPNVLFGEIPGMSGASATVLINGKEYLLGVNVTRMLLVDTQCMNAPVVTLLGIQPITKNDLGW